MTKYVIEKPYVYVVLEHSMVIEGDEIDVTHVFKECVLHGVYTDEYMALGKAASVNVKSKGFHGYISVLKKPINGMIKKSTYDSEEGEGVWDNCKYLEY